MLSSREMVQTDSQRYSMNGPRQMSNDKPQSMDLGGIHNNTNSQLSGLIHGTVPMSIPNSSSTQTVGQTSSSSVYNGFYGSGFNPTINNFEASLQWFSESRIPSNPLITDKSLNCNAHSTPSHSCCVNRLENIGMCSPLSGDSFRSNRDVNNYQTKPPGLSVNVMDSVQSWFNLQPLSNQQYNNKFTDQNLSCSQMNLPILEQSDLKQSDICLQMPDSYFEQSLNNSNNNKQINTSINELGPKIPEVNDVSANMKMQNSNYQTNLLSREWKQPPLQTNYVSSPTLFNSINESPEHYLYSLPPTTASYCMGTTENVGNIANKLQNCFQQSEKQQNPAIVSSRSLPYIDQVTQMKLSNQSQQSTNRNDKPIYDKSMTMDRIIPGNESVKIGQTNISRQKCNEDMKRCNSKFSEPVLPHYPPTYLTDTTVSHVNLHTDPIVQKITDPTKDSGDREMNDESTSGSDESNIIVEESDETEEIESVISIEEMKKSLMSDEPVELRCLVCNVKSSVETPATQFIHMNDSFPLTSASRTPVASKLIQILPSDLQHFLKLHNSFMCRRCLNLIETVEVLEVKLTSVKQTLSENFSKTIQYFLPATPILEIENGKAKIIDKEIIPCIEKSKLLSKENCLGSFNKENNHMSMSLKKDSEKPNKMTEDIIDNNSCSNENDVDNEEDEGDSDDEDDDFDDEDANAEDEDGIEVENSREGKQQQCSVCSKILSSMGSFKKHMQLHTKSFSFCCEICGKGFNLKQSLEKHLLVHNSDNRFQCEKCGRTYSQKHRLEDHLKKHAGEFRFKCSDCGKGFMQKFSLEIHIRSHTKEHPFVCELCGSRFVKEANLKTHLKICKKEDFKCSRCPEVFRSMTNLKKHEVSDHGVDPSARCEICGKCFVNLKDLKPHMRSHLEDKPFECKVCGKSYKSLSNLNHHAKTHDESKVLKCTICGEAFRRKKNLEDHMNKHSGDRKYKCTECDKAFFEQKYLVGHMKIHNNSKTKVCPVCGKEFHRGLEVHMRVHSGERPYACSTCGLAFSVSRTLLRHISSKHKKILES